MLLQHDKTCKKQSVIWQDRGFLLHYAAFGERSFIATVLTLHHGKACAWVRSNKPALVLGSSYDVMWKSRIAENLGSFSLDPSDATIWAILHYQGALRALNVMCYLCKHLLPEHISFPVLYEAFSQTIHQLATPDGLRAYDRFECALFQELGYALTDSEVHSSLCQRLYRRQIEYVTHWPDLHRLHRMRHHFVQEI